VPAVASREQVEIIAGGAKVSRPRRHCLAKAGDRLTSFAVKALVGVAVQTADGQREVGSWHAGAAVLSLTDEQSIAPAAPKVPWFVSIICRSVVSIDDRVFPADDREPKPE